jgi:hypothetical protein
MAKRTRKLLAQDFENRAIRAYQKSDHSGATVLSATTEDSDGQALIAVSDQWAILAFYVVLPTKQLRRVKPLRRRI